MKNNCGTEFWADVRDLLDNSSFPLNETELALKIALDSHNHDLRYAKLRLMPERMTVIDVERFSFARFRPLLKLIDEREVACEAHLAAPRTRAWRARMAMAYLKDLRDFCMDASADQFALVARRREDIKPAFDAMVTVAFALFGIWYAIILFRCHSEQARANASRYLVSIYTALDLLAPIIEFPTPVSEPQR